MFCGSVLGAIAEKKVFRFSFGNFGAKRMKNFQLRAR
jgi:hypothetical protein